jgi:hypothetical protein
MSYTIVYSDYNGYPGNGGNYDFLSGGQLPILPDVNLYNSFSFELKATSINGNAPSTQSDGAGVYNSRSNYASTSTRYGSSTSRPYGATAGVHIARVPTAMRWVDNLGPEADGIAQNERGDWFSREVLGKADGKGGGVTFSETPPSTDTTLNFITTTPDYEDATQMTVPLCNGLRIAGAYNSSVFCYNTFEYTNDYEGGVYLAKSLFELPEKFDNLVTFIPDQREKTTLRFTVEVDWKLEIVWGIYGTLYTSEQQNSMLSRMGYTGASNIGTDIHTITHVVNNNNNNWEKILRETLKKQRTLEEQHERYGQTFPQTQIEITPPQQVV